MVHQCDRQTDTQTTLRAASVTIDCIYFHACDDDHDDDTNRICNVPVRAAGLATVRYRLDLDVVLGPA